MVLPSQASNNRKWLLWSSVYAAIFLALMGYLNYTLPYSSDPVATPELGLLIAWGLLYLPVIVLPIAARWKVTEFGFTLNPPLLLAFLIIILLVSFCAWSNISSEVAWISGALEAFARTGEEVFFRGFLFVILTRLFEKRHRPWLWAVLVSSLLFALIHTQTFQPSFLNNYGSSSTHVVYKIIERLVNVFGIALIFALLRVWTRSVLPGAVIHCFLNTGIQTLPFVLIIYFLVVFWAYRRGEQPMRPITQSDNPPSPLD